jgi:LysR family transcriptional regulator, glycine cleavage system transcriptional activator
MSRAGIGAGRKIPPLNPLRAFEVAARHMSFTVAAEELCVTQGAVSRSVKALEDYLGEPLFERTNHGLALTKRSQAFAARLSEGFVRLGEATDEFLGLQPSPVLTVRTYTSFLIGFLIPNLPSFQVRHPEIKVHLVSATDTAEFGRDRVDVRIRYGHGKWKNEDSTLLFRDCLRPVCSPMLLDPTKAPYPVSILEKQVLLHQEFRRADWPEWLAMIGKTGLTPRRDMMFDELSIVYQAALSGVGMVMAQKAYFQREIADGRLFEPFDVVLKRGLGYYMTVEQRRRNCDHVQVFQRWLLETVQKAGLSEDSLPTLPSSGSQVPSIAAGKRDLASALVA